MGCNMNHTADDQWIGLLGRFSTEGVIRHSRNLDYYELINHTSVIDMTKCVVSIDKRKLGYKFMPAEALWILSGSNQVAAISNYGDIARYSDNGLVFNGAYGPKITEQLVYVEECLLEDPGSRQAVITIWRESPRPSKDIPCTIALQFLIRNNLLNCIATMRSSDTWMGWPYDVFNFSMVSTALVLKLGKYLPIGLGMLYLNAGSQHLYVKDYEKAIKCVDHGVTRDYTPLDISSLTSPDDLLNHLVCLRNNVLMPEYDNCLFAKEICQWQK